MAFWIDVVFDIVCVYVKPVGNVLTSVLDKRLDQDTWVLLYQWREVKDAMMERDPTILVESEKSQEVRSEEVKGVEKCQ